jgi:hypothetical protein
MYNFFNNLELHTTGGRQSNFSSALFRSIAVFGIFLRCIQSYNI